MLFESCFLSASSCHLSGNQKASEPRAIGHGWNLRGSRRRDPAEVILALREAALGCGCQVHHAGPFLLSCTHGMAGGRVVFKAEVCHLSTGTSETSNGVRYTRLWGAPLAFRDIATQISKDLELWVLGCVRCVNECWCVWLKGGGVRRVKLNEGKNSREGSWGWTQVKRLSPLPSLLWHKSHRLKCTTQRTHAHTHKPPLRPADFFTEHL